MRRGQRWALAVRRKTLRRRLRRLPVPSSATPTVRGVDDLALRNRPPSGPVRSDLERPHPVALLPERPAAPVAPWRRAPPGLEVITRDRSHASAEGARQGAPTALPVADRCPLLQHRAAALEQGCTTQHPVLAAVHAAVRQQPGALAAGPAAGPVPPPATPPRAQPPAAQRAAGRRSLPRGGPCTARAGPSRPSPPRRAAAVPPASGLCASRQGRCRTTAARLDAVASLPPKPLAARAGRRAAGRRCRASGHSHPRATRGARAGWRPLPAAAARRRAWPPDARAGGRRGRAWRRPRARRFPHAGRRGSCSDARPSARRPRRRTAPRCAPSRPRSPRRSTSPRTWRSAGASGRRRRARPGARAPPPGRRRPCNAVPQGSTTPLRRSQRAGHGPGPTGRSRALSTASPC